MRVHFTVVLEHYTKQFTTGGTTVLDISVRDICPVGCVRRVACPAGFLSQCNKRGKNAPGQSPLLRKSSQDNN